MKKYLASLLVIAGITGCGAAEDLAQSGLFATPTPTSTPTPVSTITPEITPTAAPTNAVTPAPVPSATPTADPTPTASSQPTPVITPTPITTPQPSSSPNITPTATPLATVLPSPTQTPVSPTPSPGDSASDVEQALTNTPQMLAVKAAIATRSNELVAAISAGKSTNPANVIRVEGIVSASDWEYLFPKRTAEYTYDNFLKAVGKFSGFCADYGDGRDADAICRRSLATLFAHFTQETGGHTAHWDVEQWRQGLVHVREMGWTESMRGGYNGECNTSVWQGQTWPCGTFEDGSYLSYFGRGAKQLSYNYNYGPFSDAMFGDVRVLLDNPALVADTWLNLASAVFFFVYPQPPKPAMLHVIDGTWQPNARDLANSLTPGFGVTTQIINGGVECGGSVEVAQSINRISYYRSFANYLNVDIAASEVLGCAGMKQFDAEGAGALNIYWEQDWSWVAANPNGLSYACKLVGYQTPFSAFKEGDYARCVIHHFGALLDDDAEPQEPSEPIPTVMPTVTPAATVTPTPTASPAVTVPPLASPTNTPLATPVTTPSPSPSVTLAPTAAVTPVVTPVATPVSTPVTELPSDLTYGEYNKVYRQDSGKVIASYFVEWGVYGRNYHVADIPAANLTHLLFGFIAICGDNPHVSGGAQAAIQRECADKQDYQVTMIDRFANLEKTYPGDTWIDDVNGQNYNGSFNQLRKLKQQYPHLTILPSVGGWSLSTPFYSMAKDPAKRAIFVNSLVAFISKYDFFDGVDIDWEYPVIGGTDPHLSSVADRQGYTVLMAEMRAALDSLSQSTGRTYQITSAVGAGPERIAAVDYAAATPYMDYVFLMTYDFAGTWESTTGHHTPLYANHEIHPGFNTHAAVNNMLNAGVPKEKLVVGAAFYGRGWTATQNSNNHPLFPLYGQSSTPSSGTWEAGVYDFKDLHQRFIGPDGSGINGFSAFYDETAEAAYLWNPSNGEFITYDSPRSVRAKAEYVDLHNLGGMLSWEIDADNGLLLNAVNEGLGNSLLR